MKKKLYTLAFLTSFAVATNAQNVGVNTDGSNPDGDAILHIKNDGASGKDSSVVRIENEQNGANDVTGLELFNSGTGTTAKWDVYIPASGSTDLRIKNNGTENSGTDTIFTCLIMLKYSVCPLSSIHFSKKLKSIENVTLSNSISSN